MQKIQLDWQQLYKPAGITNQQLGDDWRLFVAAIANLDADIDEPYNAKEICVMAVACAKEIAKRVQIGNMKYTVAGDRGDAYEKLWSHVRSRLELWELSALAESLDSTRREVHDSKHRRDECMSCSIKPEYEVLWAEGMAHAWFCEKHLEEWLKDEVASCAENGFFNKNCSVNSVKKLDTKEASKKFGDNKNQNILNSFLSKITMPKVNKEKKEEKEVAWRKQESIGLRDAEELAPVNPSGIELGEEITIEEVKKHFKSFYRTKPYISLVGGICNWGKTRGDVDVFINAKQKDEATELRIIRMFPREYWHRFRFMYPGEMHPGKFTNYIDIFNEKIELIASPKLVLMSSPKKVELFKFAKLLKPAHGHWKGEEYDIDNLLEVVDAKPEWYEKGIYVQKKFDGVHVRCDVKRHYESGFDIKIWTEEGNEISVRLPTLCKALGEVSKGHAMALVGELEFWEDKKHQSRQRTTAIIHTKDVHPAEDKVVLNVFDILYYNKKDIHELPSSTRLKFLAKLSDTEHIKKADYKLVHTPDKLEAAVKFYASEPGSEGAYLKRADFPYELDGKTLLNLKYKNTFSWDVAVKTVDKIKGANAWSYLCVIEGEKGEEVPCGKTYNCSLGRSKTEPLREGDILKIEFVNLNKYTDPITNRVWYNMWSPRPLPPWREDKKKPDNTFTAEKLVEASHGTVSEKPWPTRYVDSVFSLDWARPYKPLKLTNKQLADDWRLFVAAIANLDAGKDEPFSFKDIYMWATACLKEIAKRVKAGSMKFAISKEKSKSYKKLWNSVSEKVEHEFSDMEDFMDVGDVGQEEGYMQSPSEDKKWLGMLQFDTRKKNVGIDFRWQVSDSTIAAFTVFVPKGLSRVPEDPADAKKILTNEILPLTKETLADPLKKFNCQPKDNISATKDVFKEMVGYGPGYDRKRYMWTVDSFKVEHGCKKQHYVELFCEGNLLSGRILFVKIPNKTAWEKTPEGDYTWMFFKAKTQLPYVLSARAVKKKFVPPYNASALPQNLRSKIPGRFQYWKKKDEKMRLECRDELVEGIKEKLVKLDERRKVL